VLEHSARPARFLAELQRVAKAGYIETPDAFMERINPYRDHRLEVTVRNGRLLIHKKPAWRVDEILVERYEAAAKRPITRETIPGHPFDFHTRFYWQGRIDYEIDNPAADAAWAAPDAATHAVTPGGARGALRTLLRGLLSQGARNRALDFITLLRCITCGHGGLRRADAATLRCEGCAATYAVRNGIPVLTVAVTPGG
jgi:hypothetical protein